MASRVIIAFVLMSCIAFAGDAPEGYDRLTVDVGFGTAEKLDPVRHFIMEHWTQRRRAYVHMTARSIEGARTTSQLYIEPSSRGVWHIRDIVHHAPSSALGPGAPKGVRQWKAADVQWRRHELGQRHLVVLDSSGEVITDL